MPILAFRSASTLEWSHLKIQSTAAHVSFSFFMLHLDVSDFYLFLFQIHCAFNRCSLVLFIRKHIQCKRVDRSSDFKMNNAALIHMSNIE